MQIMIVLRNVYYNFQKSRTVHISLEVGEGTKLLPNSAFENTSKNEKKSFFAGLSCLLKLS